MRPIYWLKLYSKIASLPIPVDLKWLQHALGVCRLPRGSLPYCAGALEKPWGLQLFLCSPAVPPVLEAHFFSLSKSELYTRNAYGTHFIAFYLVCICYVLQIVCIISFQLQVDEWFSSICLLNEEFYPEQFEYNYAYLRPPQIIYL